MKNIHVHENKDISVKMEDKQLKKINTLHLPSKIMKPGKDQINTVKHAKPMYIDQHIN